jgi:hypothetical protein
MKNITLISASYNTPFITKTMLTSFVSVHSEGPHLLQLYDNSTNDETAKLLREAGVPFITQGPTTHGCTCNTALSACTTDYALVVDTDVIFLQPCLHLIELFNRNPRIVAVGTVSDGRTSGKNMYPRINPWLMFLNVKLMKQYKINFYDKRKTENGIIYDVGSSFLHDVSEQKLQVVVIQGIEKFAKHAEGLSWYTNRYTVSGAIGDLDIDASAMHSDAILYQRGRKRNEEYQVEIDKYKDVILQGKFVSPTV